ncbi:MAG: SH3 domain-containing protein [Rhodospirillales bacterium]|nr:SH3 domain-containing protein [Rhodospirillales bacterium]MDE2576139.1 SH3 domain-containing protein [Rhodospirillales bacterium]
MLAVAGLLSGCAQGQFSTRESRIGPDDGTDSCRPQLVALDSTGNFFGAQILTGAAIGAVTGGALGALIGRDWKGALIGAAAGGALGAAGGYWSALQQQHRDQAGMMNQVQGDLSRENEQIDRTQLAFNQLTDCRFRQGEVVRADYRAGRIDRTTAVARMGTIKQRAERDLALARQINQQIQGRGQQFTIAADKIAPGSSAAIASASPPPRRTTVRRPVKLKLHPDPNAPEIGQLQARQPVTVTPSAGGYALVQTDTGTRGYAPTTDLLGPTRSASPGPASASGPASSGEVRTLAGSNAARRDSFAQSVAVSEQATSTGFELAG